MPHPEIEAMLAERYGGKLEPVKMSLADYRPKMNEMDIREAQAYKSKQRFAAALELQPEHLRADRLKELVAAGKTRAQIMQMYHFKSSEKFDERVDALGCTGIVGRGRKRKGKTA